jgi:hypothetical protein
VGASHNFSDVPDSAFYHDFVDFLVDNGITSGCGPGLYCGESPVTRGQIAVFLTRLADAFEIVHHSGPFTNATFTVNTVTCPTGKRPFSGGGNTDRNNFFLTDIAIASTSVTVRWESDNNALVSGTSDAWALCAPG